MNITPAKTIILIPAYNGASQLEKLITQIKALVPEIDILVVNDGSTDETSSIVKNQNCIVLTNDTNQGKGYSLKRGFVYAVDKEFDYLITIDADLQHCPEDIPRFISNAEEDQIAIGTRDLSVGNMPLSRWLSNNLTSLMVSVFGGKVIRDSQSGFRMFDLKVLRKMKAESNRFDFESELLFQTGLFNTKIKEVSIRTIYNNEKSSISHFGDTIRFIRQIWKRIML